MGLKNRPKYKFLGFSGFSVLESQHDHFSRPNTLSRHQQNFFEVEFVQNSVAPKKNFVATKFFQNSVAGFVTGFVSS